MEVAAFVRNADGQLDVPDSAWTDGGPDYGFSVSDGDGHFVGDAFDGSVPDV